MTIEDKARAVGNNPEELKARLIEAKAMLHDGCRTRFGRGEFDFTSKQLRGNNGLTLQWRLRSDPSQPESYENQQTSCGTVIAVW